MEDRGKSGKVARKKSLSGFKKFLFIIKHSKFIKNCQSQDRKIKTKIKSIICKFLAFHLKLKSGQNSPN